MSVSIGLFSSNIHTLASSSDLQSIHILPPYYDDVTYTACFMQHEGVFAPIHRTVSFFWMRSFFSHIDLIATPQWRWNFYILEVPVLKAHPQKPSKFSRRIFLRRSFAWKRVEFIMSAENHETHIVNGSECGFRTRTLAPTDLQTQANVASGHGNERRRQKRVWCSRVFCSWSIMKALLWQRFHSQLLSAEGLTDEDFSAKSITADNLLVGAAAKTKEVKLCFPSGEYIGQEALTRRLFSSRSINSYSIQAASW